MENSLSIDVVVLPAFQVQVLICTSDSGSNPERASCRQIWMAVNDLIRKPVRGVKVVTILSKLSLGKTFITCLVGRSFATEGFCMKYEALLSLRTWFRQWQHLYVRLTLVWCPVT